MISLKLNKKSLVIVPVAASLVASGILLGYANYPGSTTAGTPAARRPPGISPGAKAPVNTDPAAVNRASVAKAEARAARRPATPTWPQ